ncbi:inositol monophosphatase family protein [Brevibacillus choshinensis]|uniref:Inositol monophosphatase n=1 Tax=Brevibacillus choshinensis TaxID=54911 RepID=A0ABX7FST0_BRECH|nr:inositol monophosphatase family protein [Brevibacillus choshinensis]QRG68697.1 inositol monophosphatase [Brevibacillus choshinensis]
MNAEDLRFCEELVRNVGQDLLTEFAKSQPASSQEEMVKRFQAVNPVAENRLKEALAERFPAYRWSDAEFDMELQSHPEYDTPYWVCDAIDGAVHFLQQMPMWAMSLCLVHSGAPVVAFVYDPCRDELFHAVAGQGAACNGEPIHVSGKTALSESILGTLFAFSSPMDLAAGKHTAESLMRVMPEAFAIRMQGSVALHLAYVASGRLDGYWEYGSGIYDWLAGALLVMEAGGCLSDADGAAFRWDGYGIVAAGPSVHAKLLPLTPVSA